VSRHHDLKTIQPFYDDIESGCKTFEVRLNDRAFQAGDTVTLREYDPRGVCPGLHEEDGHGGGEGCQYTGRRRTFRIGYVLSAGPKAPLGQHVVFSLEPIDAPVGPSAKSREAGW
jgi:hypothetical protein